MYKTVIKKVCFCEPFSINGAGNGISTATPTHTGSLVLTMLRRFALYRTNGFSSPLPLKKGAEAPNLIYGAPDGMISEPDFEIFSIIDTEETALLLRRVEKLIAA